MRSCALSRCCCNSDKTDSRSVDAASQDVIFSFVSATMPRSSSSSFCSTSAIRSHVCSGILCRHSIHSLHTGIYPHTANSHALPSDPTLGTVSLPQYSYIKKPLIITNYLNCYDVLFWCQCPLQRLGAECRSSERGEVWQHCMCGCQVNKSIEVTWVVLEDGSIYDNELVKPIHNKTAAYAYAAHRFRAVN